MRVVLILLLLNVFQGINGLDNEKAKFYSEKTLEAFLNAVRANDEVTIDLLFELPNDVFPNTKRVLEDVREALRPPTLQIYVAAAEFFKDDGKMIDSYVGFTKNGEHYFRRAHFKFNSHSPTGWKIVKFSVSALDDE